MARKVFYSFHYKPDNWRASQVRKIGTIEGNPLVSDNRWEAITNQGDAAIKKWVDEQMSGRSCAVVLIGSATSGRKWIEYEIKKAWKDGRGVVGVYIHNLKNSSGVQSRKGSNPFSQLVLGDKRFSSIAKAYDPPYSTSSGAYRHIAANLGDWIEEAIEIRKAY